MGCKSRILSSCEITAQEHQIPRIHCGVSPGDTALRREYSISGRWRLYWRSFGKDLWTCWSGRRIARSSSTTSLSPISAPPVKRLGMCRRTQCRTRWRRSASPVERPRGLSGRCRSQRGKSTSGVSSGMAGRVRQFRIGILCEIELRDGDYDRASAPNGRRSGEISAMNSAVAKPVPKWSSSRTANA